MSALLASLSLLSFCVEDRYEAAELNGKAWAALRSGDAKKSAELFDKAIEAAPSTKPRNWQRGIALYYAGRYADGAEQFEVHSTVNPQDVENTVWHLLCLARLKDGSLETARKKLLNVERDGRVPMAEVFDLFAGTGGVEAVDAAAERDGSPLARFYADLYVGLYHEASGNAEKSAARMKAAAENAPLRGSAMHDVAVAHQRIRSEKN